MTEGFSPNVSCKTARELILTELSTVKHVIWMWLTISDSASKFLRVISSISCRRNLECGLLYFVSNNSDVCMLGNQRVVFFNYTLCELLLYQAGTANLLISCWDKAVDKPVPVELNQNVSVLPLKWLNMNCGVCPLLLPYNQRPQVGKTRGTPSKGLTYYWFVL